MIFKVIYSALFFLPVLSMDRFRIIQTNSGPVKGKVNHFNGTEYYSYQGIPYAENPTGNLRFKPPVPKKPWNHVFDATKDGPVCLQLTLRHFMEETTEDCLSLNIYVPVNTSRELLPIMVFVHGGALQYLSGNVVDGHGPNFLLEQEIIFVTMNYRLGLFGFLSLNIEEASGNAGLKDVILSLKWIKQNIEHFGGNSDKITIAGLSSGSLLINFLMLTNQSIDLFNRAMLFSGSAFTPRSFARYPLDVTFTLANELGIQTDDVYKILDHLREKDAFEILDAYGKLRQEHNSPIRRYAPFVPSKEVKSDHALFTDNPLETFRKNDGIPINIPVVVGITTQEAISLIPYVTKRMDEVEKLRENQEDLIPTNIEYPIGSQRSKDLARKISETYFGDEHMSNLTLSTLIEFISDTQFIYGINYWVKKYKNTIGSNILYFYVFDFVGDLNRSKMFKSYVSGTSHGDDASYFLTHSLKPVIPDADERSQRMVKTMVSMVKNFVSYGDPTPDGLKDKFKWPDYGREQNYLLLNEDPVLQKFNTSPLYPRMRFWEDIYEEYYNYVDRGGELQKKIIP